jgi:hypothetical protein
MDQGYLYCSVDGNKIAVHRLVVEQREGRMLGSHEIVHHVDHDPLNNAPENLVILNRSEHMQLHTAKRSRWSAEEIARARTLHRAGMTIQETAKALRRPYPSTQRQLAQAT